MVASVTMFFAAALILLAPRVTHAAFGISPPFLNADHLVPGATFSQTIYLVQDQPNDDLGVNADLEVPDAVKSWISLDQGFHFVIPKGTRQFPVIVTVHVPSGASTSKYSGNLTFTTVPAQAGQVTIALGANLTINLTVGNNIFEQFSAPLVQLQDIEEGWNPSVLVKFQNDGNVPESFDSATFDLYDRFDAVRLAYVTKSDGFPETAAFTTKEYVVQFPVDFHLGVGDYWGVVNFYQNQKLIASQKNVFHVLKAGTLSGPLGIAMRFVQDNLILVIVAIILLVAIIAIAFMKARRRRHARNA